MAKKQKKKEEEIKAGWMASYADLVTVLFALFVMLYALSEVDEELWQQFALAAAFNPTISPFDFGAQGINDLTGNGISLLPHFELASFDRPPAGGGNGDGNDDMREAVAQLQTYFGEIAGLDGAVEVEFEDGMIRMALTGDMYFHSGRADIRPEIVPVIEAIGVAIGGLGSDMLVAVEGHTDNVPMRSAQFPRDNWELSSARALSVMRHLLGMGVIEPQNISSVGHSEYRPIADNSTSEGRAQNRRVEIFITRDVQVSAE